MRLMRDIYLPALLAVLIACGCEKPAPPPAAAPVAPPPAVTVSEPVREPVAPPREPEQSPPAITATEPKPTAPATTSVNTAAPDDKHPPLFKNWAKPDLVLVFSGQQLGYIEPCGCTGLANQKGGLARRDTFLTSLREKNWDVVPLDVGNQIRRFGVQSEVKFARTLEGLRAMGYRGAVLGEKDLMLPGTEIFSATNQDEKNALVLSANVAILDRNLTPEVRVLEAGGKRIGITGVLGDAFEKKLAGDDFVHTPAGAGLALAAAKLAAEKCDLQILLAHANAAETAALAKQFPQFDLIATSSGIGDPPLDVEAIEGAAAKQVQVGTKGMYVMAVGVFGGDKRPRFRGERVPLDDRFADSPAMLKLLADYQEQLKSLDLEGLGLKPLPHPRGQDFVGTAKCGECHTKALAVWEKTPHAHATDTLVKPKERAEIARHFDPECLCCHVTGWDPQKIFPFATGYLGLDRTPLMQHNGCENCHGPGSEHAAAEAGDIKVDQAALQKLRDTMKLPLAGKTAERRCMECHDIDNSPDFHVPGAFEKYWKQVEHMGKD